MKGGKVGEGGSEGEELGRGGKGEELGRGSEGQEHGKGRGWHRRRP